MARRGDGIGIDVTDSSVRAVRLEHGTLGRAAATVELARGTGGEGAGDEANGSPTAPGPLAVHPAGRVELVDVLARLAARLGDIDGIPTRLAWFPSGSTVQATDVHDWADADLDAHRRRLGERGMHATLVTGSAPRRRLLGLRWDPADAVALVELARAAGFHGPTVEPAPLALARVAPSALCAAEVMVGRRRGWSMLMADRTPMLAATNAPGSLTSEGPALLIAEVAPEAVRRHRDRLVSQSLSPEELAEILGQVTAAGTPLRSSWGAEAGTVDATDAGDHAVALGAAVAAAGLVRAPAPRPIDGRRPGSSGARIRPWAVERLADPPPPPPPEPWWRRALRSVRRSTQRRHR